MIKSLLHKIFTYCIATIWLVNGLFCKVLNLVPRHRLIVAEIIGEEHSAIITTVIGVAEIAMATWVITGYKPRLNAMLQIVIIASMNVIEFSVVPNLLLWGRWNLLFALVLISLIYYNEFVLHKNNSINPECFPS